MVTPAKTYASISVTVTIAVALAGLVFGLSGWLYAQQDKTADHLVTHARKKGHDVMIERVDGLRETVERTDGTLVDLDVKVDALTDQVRGIQTVQTEILHLVKKHNGGP